MIKGEKTYHAEKSVKYLFQPSYKKTDKMIVVFSAFSVIGTPPKYNYISTLAEFDCNKLFILDDFGPRATYYLCEKRDFSIERSVLSLIELIKKKYSINIIMSCGSSKGGYSALYYGLKYGFDYIVVASPQYYIGDYLLVQTNSQDSAKFMSGSDTEGDREYLNNIMTGMIKTCVYSPSIFIHLGKGETHLKQHVEPLLELLDLKNIEYELDLGDYSSHSDVSKHYPTLLKNKIREYYGYPLLEIEEEFTKVNLGSNHVFKLRTESSENKIAWYIYLNGKKMKTSRYSHDRSIKVNFEKEGIYKIKVFAVNSKGQRTSITSRKIEVSDNQLS